MMASNHDEKFTRCVVKCSRHHDLVPTRVFFQQLLTESMRDSSRSDVHETLLISYANLHVEIDSTNRGSFIRKVGTAYLPTARVWADIFTSEVGRGPAADYSLLRDVFEFWRKKAGLEATIAWGRWLLTNGRGIEASRLVVSARTYLDEAACLGLEKQWTAALDHAEAYNDELHTL